MNIYMIFSFKKFLRQCGVKYTVWKDRPGYLVVNQPNFPRLVFDFDNMDYIRIKKIPADRYEYMILSYSVENLLFKMLNHRLIDVQTVKRLSDDRRLNLKIKSRENPTLH